MNKLGVFAAITVTLFAILASAEIDRTLSICYHYKVVPAPAPGKVSPRCAVYGSTMYFDGVVLPNSIIFELEHMYPEVTTLQLNSHGGEIPDIEPLVKLIRERGIHTHVRKGAHCSSACTLLYMAGARRTAHPEAHFMFHGVNNGGQALDLERLCRGLDKAACDSEVQDVMAGQLARTHWLFAQYTELGASPRLWLEYQNFATDEKWWEHGNFLKKKDWNMTASEAVAYGVVQELTDRFEAAP